MEEGLKSEINFKSNRPDSYHPVRARKAGNVSLHRLKVLVCVAKHRHITRAAKELHISQPAVSRHLKLLEEEFGVNVYRKLSHGVELTAEGEEFLKGAESVLRDYERLRAAFAAGTVKGLTDCLRIGASFRPSVSHLPVLLSSFSRLHPGVRIVSKSGVSEELEHQVLRGDLDVALVTSPGRSAAVACERCGSGEMLAIVTSGHPLGQKRRLTGEELGKVPLIVRTCRGDRPTRTWERLKALENGGSPLTVAVDCDSHRNLLHAVKSGKGVGFCCRDYVAGEIKRGEIKVLKIKGFKHSYDNFVIYGKDRSLSESAEKFLALLHRKNSKRLRSAHPIRYAK